MFTNDYLCGNINHIIKKGNFMKYEKDGELSYTLGAFPTMEMLMNKSEVCTKIYIQDKLQITDSIDKILDLCAKKNIKIETNTKFINRISNKENCYIMGEFKKFNSEIKKGNQIVLVNPSDMGNVGTILRTALGFGFNNIIIIKPATDVFNPKVIRASMGAIFSLNIEFFENFEDYCEKYAKIKKFLFMLDGNTYLQNIEIDNKDKALIFGNEATGLDANLKKYGQTVFIKHNNKIDSLNLAISTAIAIYEFAKHN